MNSATPGDDPFDDDVPWLRDLVDEDLLVLFSEDPAVLELAVPHLIEATRQDADLESRLIDLLDLAIEHGNDDSQASLCAAIILGEVPSSRAIPVLERGLASEVDELLQDAAQTALLRIGAPAAEHLMRSVEEEENEALNAKAYEFLGKTGCLEDDALRERVLDFLEERARVERRKPPGETAIEHVFQAMAYLGDRRQLPFMREVLAADRDGRAPAIEDAIGMLEENPSGTPIVGMLPPWEERYGWLFDDERDAARVARAGGEAREGDEPEGADEAEGVEDTEREDVGDGQGVSFLFRGLGGKGREDEEEDDEEEGQPGRAP